MRNRKAFMFDELKDLARKARETFFLSDTSVGQDLMAWADDRTSKVYQVGSNMAKGRPVFKGDARSAYLELEEEAESSPPETARVVKDLLKSFAKVIEGALYDGGGIDMYASKRLGSTKDRLVKVAYMNPSLRVALLSVLHDRPTDLRRVRVARLGDLTQFFSSSRTASDTLVHKATKDLWSLKKDGSDYVIERLFDDSGSPLKV